MQIRSNSDKIQENTTKQKLVLHDRVFMNPSLNNVILNQLNRVFDQALIDRDEHHIKAKEEFRQFRRSIIIFSKAIEKNVLRLNQSFDGRKKILERAVKKIYKPIEGAQSRLNGSIGTLVDQKYKKINTHYQKVIKKQEEVGNFYKKDLEDILYEKKDLSIEMANDIKDTFIKLHTNLNLAIDNWDRSVKDAEKVIQEKGKSILEEKNNEKEKAQIEKTSKIKKTFKKIVRRYTQTKEEKILENANRRQAHFLKNFEAIVSPSLSKNKKRNSIDFIVGRKKIIPSKSYYKTIKNLLQNSQITIDASVENKKLEKAENITDTDKALNACIGAIEKADAMKSHADQALELAVRPSDEINPLLLRLENFKGNLGVISKYESYENQQNRTGDPKLTNFLKNQTSKSLLKDHTHSPDRVRFIGKAFHRMIQEKKIPFKDTIQVKINDPNSAQQKKKSSIHLLIKQALGFSSKDKDSYRQALQEGNIGLITTLKTEQNDFYADTAQYKKSDAKDQSYMHAPTLLFDPNEPSNQQNTDLFFEQWKDIPDLNITTQFAPECSDKNIESMTPFNYMYYFPERELKAVDQNIVVNSSYLLKDKEDQKTIDRKFSGQFYRTNELKKEEIQSLKTKLDQFQASYFVQGGKIWLIHPGKLERNKLTPLNYQEVLPRNIKSDLDAMEVQWLECELQRAQATFYRNIDFENPGKFELIVQDVGKLSRENEMKVDVFNYQSYFEEYDKNKYMSKELSLSESEHFKKALITHLNLSDKEKKNIQSYIEGREKEGKVKIYLTQKGISRCENNMNANLQRSIVDSIKDPKLYQLASHGIQTKKYFGGMTNGLSLTESQVGILNQTFLEYSNNDRSIKEHKKTAASFFKSIGLPNVTDAEMSAIIYSNNLSRIQVQQPTVLLNNSEQHDSDSVGENINEKWETTLKDNSSLLDDTDSNLGNNQQNISIDDLDKMKLEPEYKPMNDRSTNENDCNDESSSLQIMQKGAEYISRFINQYKDGLLNKKDMVEGLEYIEEMSKFLGPDQEIGSGWWGQQVSTVLELDDKDLEIKKELVPKLERFAEYLKTTLKIEREPLTMKTNESHQPVESTQEKGNVARANLLKDIKNKQWSLKKASTERDNKKPQGGQGLSDDFNPNTILISSDRFKSQEKQRAEDEDSDDEDFYFEASNANDKNSSTPVSPRQFHKGSPYSTFVKNSLLTNEQSSKKGQQKKYSTQDSIIFKSVRKP